MHEPEIWESSAAVPSSFPLPVRSITSSSVLWPPGCIPFIILSPSLCVTSPLSSRFLHSISVLHLKWPLHLWLYYILNASVMSPQSVRWLIIPHCISAQTPSYLLASTAHPSRCSWGLHTPVLSGWDTSLPVNLMSSSLSRGGNAAPLVTETSSGLLHTASSSSCLWLLPEVLCVVDKVTLKLWYRTWPIAAVQLISLKWMNK